ncbi:DUF6882 domain-containing protein [Mycobacteroides salmoniphilum]|nr:DUF6882 domain-containing protein [Mycobacteroides salmoniphilum]
METSSGLQDLIDRAAFLSTEHQQDMADGVGLAAWNVELTDQSFVFQTDPPTILSCHFLGSTSLDAGSWLWGWKNINDFPNAAVALAGSARRYGEEHGIPELTAEQTPLDEDSALDIGHRLTLAAKAISGKYAHYSCPSSDRSRRTWLLLEGPEVSLLDKPSAIRIPRVITETLEQGVLVDEHKALDSYAELRGLNINWDTDRHVCLTTHDGELNIELDEGGRISRINIHAEGTPDAQPGTQQSPASGSDGIRGWLRRRNR